MRTLVAPRCAPNYAITTLSHRAGITTSPTREGLADLGWVHGLHIVTTSRPQQMASYVHRRVVGPQDIHPQDELVRDFRDEHPNSQSPPSQRQLDEGLLQHREGLPRGGLQNVGFAWLPLGLSCDHVGPGEGY